MAKRYQTYFTKKRLVGKKDIINPRTGEIKTIKVDSHRLRNIYKINMRVAYSKQRYESMSKFTLSVYWRYKSALLENTRDDHRKAHGTILHKDDDIKRSDYAALSEEELTDKFYSTIGIAQGAMFIDKVNDPIIIDDSLFTTASNQTKIKKQDRHFYIDEIAQTIKEPDEIYLEFEKLNKGRLVKKYFKYYKNENGAKKSLVVLFEYQEDKTLGVTAYFINSSGTVEKKRFEKLIYQRDQGKI